MHYAKCLPILQNSMFGRHFLCDPAAAQVRAACAFVGPKEAREWAERASCVWYDESVSNCLDRTREWHSHA